MSKKIYFFLFIFIIGVIIGLILVWNNKDDNRYSDTESNTNTDNIVENQTAKIDKNTNTENTTYSAQKTVTETKKQEEKTVEKEVASFSTKIYSKDSSRQNNIKITCSTLNNTTVKPGETFSFCNTVGKSTSKKGYQEADIYDSNGKKTKGLGGGNCQVSTTLYNAVLEASDLKVTERHEHSNKVPYIKDGKDAAVAYGSYDLKFVNNSKNTIKIKASATENNVSVKLLKLSKE